MSAKRNAQLETFFNYITTELQLVTLIVFIVCFIIQLYFYLGVFLKVPLHKSTIINQKIRPVSVIICAKNEAENLRKNLPAVLEQDFPDFEVIVVDDCSTDDTLNVLTDLKQTNTHLKITSIENNDKFQHGKKLALTIGIKAAKNEWLLLTDADCMPASNKWLSFMHNGFADHKAVVLGYSGYKKHNSLINNIIRFDTMFIAMQYIGLALKGRPYMGVGRNLAYRKSLFFQNKGFASHLNLLSGDDDLFIKEVATKDNTAVELAKESHTYSHACGSFKTWYYQKRRHLTTGKYYKKSIKSILLTEHLSRMFFYAAFVFLLFIHVAPIIVLPVFIFRMTTQLIVYKLTMKKFKEKSLLFSSIIYDFLLPFINFYFIFTNMVVPKKGVWK